MPKQHPVIPIVRKATTTTQPPVKYECSKCPGYCCSYDLIEVGKRDITRIAKHFDLSFEQAEERFTKFDAEAKVRTLRHQKDNHFGKICTFFDKQKRRCTIYEARPGLCREYPAEPHCGYYDFLHFERQHQDDPEYVALTR